MRNETFGQRLRWVRQQRLLSLRDVERLTGLYRVHLINLEYDRHTPRPATVRRLAQALNVDAYWLLHGTEAPVIPVARSTSEKE